MIEHDILQEIKWNDLFRGNVFFFFFFLKSARNVLKKFGFAPSVENLNRFWKIRAKYGDEDEEIMSSVIYLRYAHLLHDCTIPVGSDAPDADLVTLNDKKPVKLSDYMKENEKLVVLAGSMT